MSKEAKLEIDEETYVDSFRPQMMDVVHAWCSGATFLQICKMTDIFEGIHTHIFAPYFEEVEEAYWFWPVRWSVRLSVCPYTCTRSRTVRDRILKFGMWVEYEN